MKTIPQGTLTHRRTGSTALWFIIGLIPVVNVYFLWKAIENVTGHETTTEKHEHMNHLKHRGSPLKLFSIVFTPLAIIGIIIAIDRIFGSYLPYLIAFIGEAGVPILMFIFGFIVLYVIYRVAKLVAGHDKPHERLEHLKEKGSPGKWFVIGIIPIVNVYFLWKAAEIISGHGTVQSVHVE